MTKIVHNMASYCYKLPKIVVTRNSTFISSNEAKLETFKKIV